MNTQLSVLRNIESGNNFPSLGRPARIAKAPGVTGDRLLGKDEIELNTLPKDFVPVKERCSRLEETCKTFGEQNEELRKKLEAVRKLVLEICASESVTQELLVERALATKEELAAREEKYNSEPDIAFVQKAVETPNDRHHHNPKRPGLL